MHFNLFKFLLFRSGCDEVFALLESRDVPLIIFSAGLAGKKNMRV